MKFFKDDNGARRSDADIAREYNERKAADEAYQASRNRQYKAQRVTALGEQIFIAHAGNGLTPSRALEMAAAFLEEQEKCFTSLAKDPAQ